MERYLDLWDISDGHPEARKELERLTRIEEAMEQIRDLGPFITPGIPDQAYVIATLALDPEGCADLARIPDLTKCPTCGGPADNGHTRELPPTPYICSKCAPTIEDGAKPF